MASLRKNVAGQHIGFQLVNSGSGAPVTAGGAGNISKDGAAQAALTGTFTHLGTGQWDYAPTQAETNATSLSFQFTGTSALNIVLQVYTDNWDTTQPVVTSGAGTDQLTLSGGIASADAKKINAVVTTGVTAVASNIGTAQPVAFTGTGGSALVKTDVTDWGATAVGTLPPDAIFIRSGTAAAGGASTITLDGGASATNNIYNGATIFLRTGGTGAGQVNSILSYNGTTKVATVGTAWAVAPDNTSLFTILATEAVAGSASDPWATALPGSYGAGTAGNLLGNAATVNADALLNRNIDGGGNGSKTVGEAFGFIRFRWAVAAGILTVYQRNGSTVWWTGTVQTDGSAIPIVGETPT